MQKQRGLSFFGIVFLIAIIGGIVSLAIKIVPNYLDFLAVSEAVRQVLEQPRITLQRDEEIMKKFRTQLSINNIDIDMLGEDAITLERYEGVMTAEINYDIEKPILETAESSLSIVMHFETAHEARSSD